MENENLIEIRFQKLENFTKYLSSAEEPSCATHGSAGYDLCAAIGEEFLIEPGAYSLIPTGIAIELPRGFEGQIRSRSGLALKYGVAVLNSPGTVDSDYRGEIKVLLINHGKEAFIVKPKMRIAQIVIANCVQVKFSETDFLSTTLRGTGGFGSTGIFRLDAS